MRRVLAVYALVLTLFPLSANAQSLIDLRTALMNLLEQVETLRAQTPAQATSTAQCAQDALLCPDGTWVGRTGAKCQFFCPGFERKAEPASCVALTRALKVGDTDAKTGGEVTELQKYLARDGTIYPERLVTGFFGPATEQAVRRWQAVFGVVASGDAETTGFGKVGPLTRFAMQQNCNASAVAAVAPETVASPRSYFATINVASLLTGSASPTLTGAAGGVSSVKVRLSSASVVILESGDIPVKNGAWTFAVTSALPAGIYTVDVTGALGVPLATGGMTIGGESKTRGLFTLSPVSGTVPFVVKFTLLSGELYNSYAIDFGDGQVQNITDTLTHTYTVPRSYTVRLTKTGVSCATCQDWATTVVGTAVVEGKKPIQ